MGLAIYEKPWNRWLYLSDLKVCREVRRMGAARRLLEEGMAIAREEGYQGVSTICQDNNLNAALFYLRAGFQIGGLDTRVYDARSRRGRAISSPTGRCEAAGNTEIQGKGPPELCSGGPF